ncbi:hypothetical protein FOZ63_032142 [Perkinsus olseni]|uniref:Neuropathy target esterase n=1 Tax=Perkinsus olseni TaxID=32597 RepID=A0A7J6Q1Q3_PEROL|nr:hypothetical protein FOZ63_032142 [Perkinsus olseni]
MALEVKLFEDLVKARDRGGDLKDVLGEFCARLTMTRWKLEAPDGELLLNPPPSYISVMNEGLCGVYPTPTGVYIRKPLERGEEVMVLQPGFQGTKAVYYYHNSKSQLFVLCEDNRKLIIYDLSASPERPGVTSEILGLPGLATCYSRKMDMVSNDDYIFILIATGHLFYINHRDIRDTVQAYLGWATDGTTGRCRHLLLDPRRPWAVRVITVANYEFFVIDLVLQQSLKIRNPIGGYDEPLVTVIPIEPGLCGVVTRQNHGVSKKRAAIHLVNGSFRQLGRRVKLTDNYKEAYHMQILNGPADAAYVLRRDTTFAVDTYPYLSEDDGELKRTRDGRCPYASDSVISDVCPDDPKRLTTYRYCSYRGFY